MSVTMLSSSTGLTGTGCASQSSLMAHQHCDVGKRNMSIEHNVTLQIVLNLSSLQRPDYMYKPSGTPWFFL